MENPEQLEAYLLMLRSIGVTEFESNDFSVKFGPIPDREEQKRTMPQAAESIWKEKRLWPNGQPPAFYKEED